MKPKIQFSKADHYAFFFEDTHLMLVSWSRDDKKELYLLQEQEADTYVLDYPGELYMEQVMDVVGNIFFITVQEGESEGKYALGAYFEIADDAYGVYYQRTVMDKPELVFFRVVSEGANYGLEVVDDHQEHQKVVQLFGERYAGLLQIH